ncbi:hypothetical protein AB0D11_46235 [Streptomyces monashensis]|uniref:hypothetical protein n=1 Tax=Streptomyces monashensis TaxID=1678012 RepID=UPI0033C21ECF
MPDPGRYHLLHTISGRPAQYSWWWDERIAREKFLDCVSLYGARITLTDEEIGETLTSWPEDA